MVEKAQTNTEIEEVLQWISEDNVLGKFGLSPKGKEGSITVLAGKGKRAREILVVDRFPDTSFITVKPGFTNIENGRRAVAVAFAILQCNTEGLGVNVNLGEGYEDLSAKVETEIKQFIDQEGSLWEELQRSAKLLGIE